MAILKNKKNTQKVNIVFYLDMTRPDEKGYYEAIRLLHPSVLAEEMKPALLKQVRKLMTNIQNRMDNSGIDTSISQQELENQN